MKKLFATEVVQNRVEILTDARGKTQFVLARRRDDLNVDNCDDTHWQCFRGSVILFVSPYRRDLYCELRRLGYSIDSSPILS